MRNEKHRDKPEKRLWPQAESDTALKELLLDYGRIKGAQGFEILAAMLWFNVYQSSSTDPSIDAQSLKPISASLTLSEYLDHLHETI
jgi:hypothetical protein